MGNASFEEKVKILKAAKEQLGVDIPNIEQLATQPEIDRVKNTELIYINAHRNHVASMTGTDIYDFRNCEQMADNYAVMFGAGAALASANSKLGEHFGSRANLSTAQNVALDIIDIFAALSSVSVSAVIGGSPYIKEYDSPKDRVRLIKDTMIGVMKDKDLPKPIYAKLNAELKEVDAVLAKMTDYEGVLMHFWKKFSKIGKSTTSVEESQKALERLLFNDLYLKSAQLRNM